MFFRPLAHFKKKIVAALSAFVPSLVYDLDAANYAAVPTNGTTVAGTGA
jgi:hypothetical protein